MKYVYRVLIVLVTSLLFASAAFAERSPAYTMSKDWKTCSTDGVDDTLKYPQCITYPETGEDYTTCKNPPKAIYFARNAEKRYRDTNGTNNKQEYLLSKTGQKMAQHLAKVFDPIPVKVIYTSDWTRTRQTACPLMHSKKVERHVVCRTETKSERLLLGALCKAHKDEVVVVVGHHDTVDEMLINLNVVGARDNFKIKHGELYKVTFKDGKGVFDETPYVYWKCPPSGCDINGAIDVKLD